MQLQKAELLIGKTMFACILISVAILLYGGILYLCQHGHDIVHEQIFHAEPKGFIEFSAIWQGVLANQAESILMLGLLTVIAGQVLRVFLTGVIFAIQRDLIFVVISVVIFAILIFNAF